MTARAICLGTAQMQLFALLCIHRTSTALLSDRSQATTRTRENKGQALSPPCVAFVTTPRRPHRRSLRRNAVQNVSASEGPISMPRTSRRPSLLTPDDRRDRDDAPCWRTFTWVASIHKYGQSPSIGQAWKTFTLSSISRHSRLTWLLEMPVMPMHAPDGPPSGSSRPAHRPLASRR